MSKHLQLSIPTPCHETWDNMTNVEKGKFCGSCQKQVVDFSNMSDREIAIFFKKPSTGSVCGRFMQDQLDRSIEIPRKRIPWVKYFFQILLPGFLMSCGARTLGKIKVNGSETEVVTKSTCSETLGIVLPETIVLPDTTENIIAENIEIKENNEFGDDQLFEIKKVITDTIPLPVMEVIGDIKGIVINRISHAINIKGKVIDENGNPISFASIEATDKNLNTAADSAGQFSITVNAEGDIIPLNVSAVGYQSQLVSCIYSSNEFIIQLKTDSKVLSEVVVTSYANTKRMGAYTVCYVTRERSSISKLPSKHDSIKIYPNPVKAGASLNIAWDNKEAGTCSLQLMNVSGQLVFTKEMWIDNEVSVLNLQLPSVPAGNYFLRMTNKGSGKSYTDKIIIQ